MMHALQAPERATPETATEQPVLVVSEQAEDYQARERAERLIRRAGATALSSEIEFDYESTGSYASLMEAVKAAAEGDEQAYQVVASNVRTDVVERTIKAGHVMRVELATNESGKIMQYGQTMDDVYVNALRYASSGWQMRERAEAETRNGMRIEKLHRQGVLSDHYFVVLSRCADNMTKQEMEDAGFFTDTMSCAIQVTHHDGSSLVTESAFVAGAAKPEAGRHDEAAVAGLGESLYVDLSGKSAAELLDTPLLIHKDALPGGVLDLVKLYDQHAGGTFFGQTKPTQDYHEYVRTCQDRELGFEPAVQEIIRQLLSEASVINNPEQATKRLHKLSEKHMVDRAISDISIDARVFGAESARYIEEARHWLEQGESDKVIDARNNAQRTAKSSSCPTGTSQNETDDKNKSDKKEKSEKKWMSCPFCGAKVFGDPCAARLSCGDCSASVANGVVVSKGNGGKKVRLKQAIEERRTRAAATRKAATEKAETHEYALAT